MRYPEPLCISTIDVRWGEVLLHQGVRSHGTGTRLWRLSAVLRPATDGRPGDGKGGRPDRFERRFRMFIATPFIKMLQRPLESSQYAATRYQHVLTTNGMSRKGNCWDNTCVESLFGTLKRELVYHRRYTTRREATQDIFE